MLSFWLCYFGTANLMSHYSRKIYVSWKKKCCLYLQNLHESEGVVKKGHCSEKMQNAKLNKTILQYNHRLKMMASPLAYYDVCNTFSYARQCRYNAFIQKRCISYKPETSKAKRVRKYVVALLPNKFFRRFIRRSNTESNKPFIRFSKSNSSAVDTVLCQQHELGFPNFFSKEAAFKAVPGFVQFNSDSPLKELRKNNQSTPNAISICDTTQSKYYFASNRQNSQDDKQTQNAGSVKEHKDDELNSNSSAIVQRSQYENVASTLSSKELTNQRDEKSILDSLRTYVEIPVNSFFSFISRANAAEKRLSNSSNSSSDNEQIEEDFKEESGQEKELQIPETKSLLELLYQYIPYIRSSPSPECDESKSKRKETDNLRLKAEKELLRQKVNINNRTRYLLQVISTSNSLFYLAQYVEELKDHLLRFPDTRISAVKEEDGIKQILHIYRTTHDNELLSSLRMILAMLGVVDPPKMKGVRILAIDGGGSRGLACVEICRRLVELTGRPINELFDYVCGVSTGAILGFALGIKKMSLDDVALLYRKLSSDIFKQGKIAGTGGFVFSHAYYNTEFYQKKMRHIFGNQQLIETSSLEDVPKCSAVSTLVNRLPLKPFLWRNYNFIPATRDTHWSGTCHGTMWEAIRASSAAPFHFEEYKKECNIHQDGGVLTNNPTGLALNECRLLWPNDPIQCVVSVGTGRYEPIVGPVGEEFSSWRHKLMNFVDSATNVTEIHNVMYDLLPSGSYFRFNPYMDEPLLLNEYRCEKLDMLVENTLEYIEANDYKFRACANTLLGKRVNRQKC